MWKEKYNRRNNNIDDANMNYNEESKQNNNIDAI